MATVEPVLHDLPVDTLRARVEQSLRDHFEAPRFCAEPARPPRDVRGAAQCVLDTMLTRQFRVGPLPPQPVHEKLLERICLRVARGQPIKLTVGYSPLKNLNSVPYSRADWSEFFALAHLAAWHNKVQAVYPPGLAIKIVFDDSTLAMANLAARRVMDSYINSIPALVQAMGLTGLIRGTLRQSMFAWIFRFGLYAWARRRVRAWEQDPLNREQLDRMDEFARRNVVVPDGLSGEQRERYVLDASHRYRVYWEALQMSGLTRRKGTLIAMYLDGHQHHIRDPLALHLTTVAKGQVTQPWQGRGVLLDNGHDKLVPYVLTQGRQQSHRTRLVEGLGVVPLPGFDRIEVAWPTEP